MRDEDRNIATGCCGPDFDGEVSLRPRSLAEFIGQEKVKAGLNVYMRAAIARRAPLDHMLLYGPPGLGKTTLAGIVADEMGQNLRVTSGQVLKRDGDLAAMLTNFNAGDVLFIDDIHRLSQSVEEVLYPAMEDFALDIIIGKGTAARSIRVDIPKFTLIGAAPSADMLSAPLLDRFGIRLCLETYAPEELAVIVENTAKRLKVACDRDAALEIGSRSRGIPRIANQLTRRARDFAEVLGNGRITLEIAREALDILETAAGERDEEAAGRPDGRACE